MRQDQLVHSATAASPPAYTPVARALHWIMAVLVLTMVPLGIVIANQWGGGMQTWLYNLHKSLGVVVAVLIVVRIGYRLGHAPAPLPPDISAPQRFLAGAVHLLLYALLLAQPFVGWIATAAYPAPVPMFGLFTMPAIWPADRALSDFLFIVHRAMGVSIGVLASMHIAAALHHHFIRRDGVLRRMISG